MLYNLLFSATFNKDFSHLQGPPECPEWSDFKKNTFAYVIQKHEDSITQSGKKHLFYISSNKGYLAFGIYASIHDHAKQGKVSKEFMLRRRGGDHSKVHDGGGDYPTEASIGAFWLKNDTSKIDQNAFINVDLEKLLRIYEREIPPFWSRSRDAARQDVPIILESPLKITNAPTFSLKGCRKIVQAINTGKKILLKVNEKSEIILFYALVHAVIRGEITVDFNFCTAFKSGSFFKGQRTITVGTLRTKGAGSVKYKSPLNQTEPDDLWDTTPYDPSNPNDVQKESIVKMTPSAVVVLDDDDDDDDDVALDDIDDDDDDETTTIEVTDSDIAQMLPPNVAVQPMPQPTPVVAPTPPQAQPIAQTPIMPQTTVATIAPAPQETQTTADETVDPKEQAKLDKKRKSQELLQKMKDKIASKKKPQAEQEEATVQEDETAEVLETVADLETMPTETEQGEIITDEATGQTETVDDAPTDETAEVLETVADLETMPTETEQGEIITDETTSQTETVDDAPTDETTEQAADETTGGEGDTTDELDGLDEKERAKLERKKKSADLLKAMKDKIAAKKKK